MEQGLLNNLVESLCCLPGVGRKSAQRMAFHLLERDRSGGLHLAEALDKAMQGIGECHLCRTFSEKTICNRCSDPARDQSILCIVEMPSDIVALSTVDYKGLFFVLKGRLSPIDGIGPHEIGLDILEQRLAEGQVREIILATNATIEGQATAHYIAEMGKKLGIDVMKIAQGVPLGGELEYIDSNTLSHAFKSRVRY